jgi:hypothetical protein
MSRSCFFLLGLALFFSSCRKDNISPSLITKAEKTDYDNPATGQKSKAPKIKLEDAQKWYNEQAALNLNSFNGNDRPVFQGLRPNWDTSFDGTSSNVRQFLLTTLNLTVDDRLSRFLVTHDSAGNLTGKFVLYLPDPAYHQRTQGHFQVSNFTGIVLYVNLNGSFSRGY